MFPAWHILTTSISPGWGDLYYTGAVQKDGYDLADQQINEKLKSDASNSLEAPANAKPARSFASCSGSYTQDYYGTVRIVPNATGLLVYPGHKTTPFLLVPYDGDTFRDTSEGSTAKFTMGSDETATSVWFTWSETPGRNGTFIWTFP